jgi:hypothetical protein
LSEYANNLNDCREILQNCINDYKNVNKTVTTTRKSLFESKTFKKGIKEADIES